MVASSDGASLREPDPRSKQDRGAVLILDTRVTTERFGRAFLRSLPTAHRLFKTPESLLSGLEEWFSANGAGRDE